MDLTILGSGGCMVIPKPLCTCRVCREAREKGLPYARTGPSAFLHDENLLIDTPAEISLQLNHCGISTIDHLIFTHLDPDHVEGMRVVEQVTLDFRTWRAYEGKTIKVHLPEELNEAVGRIRTVYGPAMDFYEESGFIQKECFREKTRIGGLKLTAIPVKRGDHCSFVHVYEKEGKRLVYAPCDIRPFPEQREEVQGAELLVIQPGIFEHGLRHGFEYPPDHVSRTTLYTFEQTMELGKRIGAERILFTHLEEYWHRSYDDYCEIRSRYENIDFAHDGMRVRV